MLIYAAPEWVFISKSNMKRRQAVQNRVLRLIGGYDWYTSTRADRIHSDLEMIKLNNFIKYLALKLYAYARNSTNRYIKKYGTDSLVANRRVPKPFLD